jgi:hypothetical protein
MTDLSACNDIMLQLCLKQPPTVIILYDIRYGISNLIKIWI